ncbi:MAG: M56 family metallopeptidase [Rhodanobacter sp.]
MITLPIWLAATRMIGWTLVHFLWQGAVLGVVYWLARPFLARGVVRYRFGMGVLFALALCPFVTLWQLLGAVPSMTIADHGSLLSAIADPSVMASSPGGAAGFDALLPWLVLAWSLGVLLHSVRAWRQWCALKAVVRIAERVPRWQQQATAMAQRFGLHRPVRVLGSRIIASPVLIGWMRPVILLPMAVICGFPASQIELILAHELAHLRRWDPLVNLFQVALETAHFYHPVVRWISRDVTSEREICCDQLALTLSGGSRREFVTMLAELGDLRVQQQRLLLAANGGELLERAQLMMLPQTRVIQTRKYAYALALVFCAAVAMVTLRLQRIQGELNDGVNTAIRQLQALALPASISLARPDSAWVVPDLVRIPLVSVALFGAKSGAAVARPLPPLKPASLQSATGASVLDLKLGTMEIPVLRIVPTVAPPATTVATPVPRYVRQPVYPSSALSRGVEGRVVLEFTLDGEGDVRNLQVIRSTPEGVFDQAALDAMHYWKYVTSNGTASTRYRQLLSFTLSDRRADRMGPAATAPVHNMQARLACHIPTGTHICRRPDEEASPGRVLAGGSPQ